MYEKCFVTAVLLLCSSALAGADGPIAASVSALISRSRQAAQGKYPISFWSYTNLREHGKHFTEAEVESWADAGFTVPQSPSFDPADPAQVRQIHRILDWSKKHGMRLILCDPRGSWRPGPNNNNRAMPADFQDRFRESVKEFGSHPALFGYHVGDEPDAGMKRTFFEVCKVEKEIAPHLHPYANLLPFFPGIEERAGTDTWPKYLDSFCTDAKADLVSYDCYTQMNPGEGGWESYFENLRLYREAALRNGVPFWNTVLSVGHYNYRVPNTDEVKWQFNTTVGSGAHGLLWFFYYMREPHGNYRLSPVDEHWNRTPTYDAIRRVQKSFHKRYGDLFTRLACTRVRFHGKAYGGGELFSPDGVVSKVVSDGKVMVSNFVDEKGRRYAMIVNLSMTDNSRVWVTFPGADARAFSLDWGGHEYEGPAYCGDSPQKSDEGLTIHHFLAPGQEAVYRIESSAAAGPRA